MFRFLVNPWFLGALGVTILSLLIYFLGPLFAFGTLRPLESVPARWIAILLVVIIWLARRVIHLIRSKNAEKQLVQGVVEAPVQEVAETDHSQEELNTLKGRFEEAVDALSKTSGKRRLNLYDLPWYVIIGPPGSGKTTALQNSGLRFPLAERFGPEAIRGIGGTRDCDWWFTDDAILIDTAGRYTTQDSDASKDNAGWLGFLDLLKKYRKRRPINGIFIAISVSDLLSQSEAERQDHIRAIRARTRELDEHFGVRFPVYVLLTKSDLISGFSEFFDDLGRTQREQVWGATFPYSDQEENPIRHFDREFSLIKQRLDQQVLDKLNQEGDQRRRVKIQGFPKQVQILGEILQPFLENVFQASQFESTPLLRGFYFVSGTQEGSPIDRLMGSLAQTFQVEVDSPAPVASEGKSYFIKSLLTDVAFLESQLAGTNRKLERRLAWLRNGSYAAIGVVLITLFLGWTFFYFQVLGDIEQAEIAVTESEQVVDGVSPRDLEAVSVLTALDLARDLPGGYRDQQTDALPWRMGLSQHEKFGDVSQSTYRYLLDNLFLSRVILRLENQIRRGGSSPDYVYEALKTYLMFDSKSHYDADSIKAFLQIDWLANLRREVSTEQRDDLVGHIDAMLEQRTVPLPLPLDEGVIATARREVQSVPLENRIYGRLKRTTDKSIQGFNIRDAAGGTRADLVFVRKSGRPLAEPIHHLFTREAYQTTFVERSSDVTSEVVSEAWWILGEEEEISFSEREQMLARVRDLYLEEFAQSYSDLILDIGLAPFSTPQEAMTILQILSSSDSPLLLLLMALSEETELDKKDEEEAGLTSRVESGAADALQRLRGVIGVPGSGSITNRIPGYNRANLVAQKFQRLNRLVETSDTGPRPIDRLLVLVAELNAYMASVSAEAAGGAIPPHVQAQGQAVMQQLKLEANQQPPMLVGEVVNSAVNNSVAITTGGLRAYINDLWQSGPLRECEIAIAGRYPVSVRSQQIVRLEDFGQFFGYGGTLDAFFNSHLKNYVDVTRNPWTTRRTGNVPIRLSQDSLRAFQYADVIKRTFFRPGSTQPSVSFDLIPLEMDTSLSNFFLHVEGKELSYAFGPKTATYMQWPGPNPGSEVRVEMKDRNTGQTYMRRLQGPWAWFRLLDEGGMHSTNTAEEFEVDFRVQGKKVAYELIARSAFNPFALKELQNFQCPKRL